MRGTLLRRDVECCEENITLSLTNVTSRLASNLLITNFDRDQLDLLPAIAIGRMAAPDAS